MLTGKARLDYLASLRRNLRSALNRLVVKGGRGVSYCEVHGEILSALEELAHGTADEIRFKAQVCRDEYSKPDGGRASAVSAAFAARRAT